MSTYLYSGKIRYGKSKLKGLRLKIGFSVKSYIGNKPTLLNASGATVINYTLLNLIDDKQMEEVNLISTPEKIKDRVQKLSDFGVELRFLSLISSVFTRNLQMIDFRMFEILAYLYLSSYFVKGKAISDVVKFYCEKYDEDIELIEHKVKDLLVASALGMEPNTKWDGLEDANGGYIVVKDDGEVLCYHIYDRNKLRNYLYRNTKFDSPSSSRTGAGLIMIEPDGNEQRFKLTIQIRF